MLREADVKVALRDHVIGPGTDTVFEFWVPRSHERADVAVIGTTIDAFEIKTARDTLKRLPRQAEAYSRIFDTCHAVVAACHLERTMQIVPPWWGALLINADAPARFTRIRGASVNASVDPEILVRLLWREEAYEALCAHGAEVDPSLGRSGFWQHLLALLDLDALRQVVRNAIAGRDPARARIPSQRFAVT